MCLLPSPERLEAFQNDFCGKVAIWVLPNSDVALKFGRTKTIYTYRNFYQGKKYILMWSIHVFSGEKKKKKELII